MKKITNTKTLTICALLLALAVVLGFFKIPISPVIELRFGSLPIAIGGSLFGPAIGGIIGALSDLLAYLVKPTGPFFPGFTISSMVSGIIFGTTLRRKKNDVSIQQIILAQILNMIIVGMILNNINLFILYSDPATGIRGFFALLVSRLPKELIMLPINTFLLALALKPVHFIELQVLHGEHK